jgi:flagellar motor protein MotB
MVYGPNSSGGRAVVIAVAITIGVAGCASNPFRTAPPAGPLNLEPPPGVATPAHMLPQTSAVPPAPSYADLDGRSLASSLERSRQESQLMQDQIAALRDQLASTSTQLAQTRSAGMPATAGGSGVGGMPPAPDTQSTALRSAMSQLAITGADTRFDGAVVRLDIQAERLFEPGTANLLPGGAAILTQVASELDRVYPGHFIGIEGHVDTEPLVNAAWASPHQLTAARAAAVFDFFTTRTRLREAQLFLVAHGSNHPLVSNATAAGRSRNRRMELVVYPEVAAAAAP